MVSLLDIYNQKSDEEKAKIKDGCAAMVEQAVSLHNGAVLGILPGHYKMEGVKGLIKDGS